MNNAVRCVLFFTFLLQSSKCARKDLEGFVVGGRFTNIQEHPHSVFLKSFCKTEWICGGSILTQQFIVTAAHCIFGCNIRMRHHMEVYAGSGSLKSVQIKRFVKRAVVHQRYDEKQVLNDIGLALVERNIPLGRNTKRIIIRKSFPFDSVTGKVAGWGTVNEATGATSITLKHVDQKLRSKQTCAKIGHLIPGMFCAGSENFYEDHPAQGDSGSALVTSAHTAIGLVSFRIPVYPALMVYTNVTFYYNWLTTQVQQTYCNG